MTKTAPHSPSPAPQPKRRAGRPRATRVAIVGGLAVGSAFAALTGISIANTNTSHTHTTSGPRSSASGLAPRGPHGRGFGPRGGPRGPGVLGGLGGPGGPGALGGPNSGTITAINGTTLTLRTENGTETVDTSASTAYSEELQTISFSDLRAGDIVGVTPAPPSSRSSSGSASASTPPQPGTGTVKAVTVTVVKPSFTGRVISNSNGTYSLVGPGGELFTVTTTSSTRYYDSSMSRTSAAAISSGDHVMAEGTQSDLTHLAADVIAVMPTPPTPRAGAPAPPRPPSTSGAPRSARTARSGSTSPGSRSGTKRRR